MKKILLSVLYCAAFFTTQSQVNLQSELSLKNKEENARVIAFTANSKRLVVGGDKGTLNVFEIPGGDSWNLPPHATKVIALGSSFDNRYVASAGEDGNVLIYDFQETKSLKLNGAPGLVKAIAFSPSGLQLATANEEGKIFIWDINTREKIASFQGRAEKVLSIAFSPDGRILASGSSDNSIQIWSVEKQTLLNSLTGHSDWVRAVAFSPDGKSLASASYDKSIRIWDIESYQIKSTLTGHRNWALDVHYSPDGKYLISGGADGKSILLNSDYSIKQQIQKLDKMVCSTAFSNDGKFIAIADLSNTTKLYNSSALAIQPWKPYDVMPPAIVILSPRLMSTRDAATGIRKSIVHQSKVKVLIEVTDLSGIKNVEIGGVPVSSMKDFPDRYQFEADYALNSEKILAIKATDLAGNTLEEKLIIEHQRFSGSVDAKKYHALLIGVQDYKSTEITDLDQPMQDLHRFKNALLKNYSFEESNISVLENPDRHTLYAKLDELQAKLDKIDNLLIFYAGHGYWDQQLQQGYWLPSDAEPNRRSTWLSNGTLRDYISAIPARHMLLITDACFSGGIFKSRAVFENASTAIETLYLRKSRKAMTSGTLEKVPDKSVFIDFLIRRLEENQEPFLSTEELFSSMRKEVINNSPNSQVPQYGEIGQTGDEGGEFIFVRKN